jgi:CRISPR-associated endonuclease Cas2
VKVFEEFACVRVQKSIFFVDCSKETIEKIRQEVKNYFKKESLIIVPLEADMINKALFLYKSPKVRSRGDIFI